MSEAFVEIIRDSKPLTLLAAETLRAQADFTCRTLKETGRCIKECDICGTNHAKQAADLLLRELPRLLSLDAKAHAFANEVFYYH